MTNNTSQSGTPTLEVTGLTLGTMTFTSNTCTTGLAPGGACTAIGHLTATTAGQVDFQVIASSTALGTPMAAFSVVVFGSYRKDKGSVITACAPRVATRLRSTRLPPCASAI